MKQLLTCLLFIMTVSHTFSQVTIEPDCIFLEGTDVDEIKVYVDITNNNSEETLAFWTFEAASGFPSDWKFQVCDTKQCYQWGTDTSSIITPFVFNTIAPGQTVLFTVTAQNIANTDSTIFPITGTSSGVLRLFDNMEFENHMAESGSCSVSTNDTDYTNDLVIYPNPTTDVFQLKNDTEISAISIFNVVGRQISRLNHTPGKVHDVSQLREGIYLVRLENQDGEVLKTMRLSKR